MTINKDTLNKVYNVDSRLILKTISFDTKVRTTITSPPYFDMKDYGVKNQVGYGQRYDDYLNDLKQIFEDILKVTEEDGTLWIIIDTFKRKNQVVSLPFDLANKLKEVGWLFQEVIIWKKDKTVPWSSTGFMQRKFEYILFFSKSTKYKSNKDKVRIYNTSQLKKWWIKYPERYNPKGKALDEIWEFPIPVQGSWGDQYIKHFCPLPKDMVSTMIQISTDEGDIILDPFAGSGTVLSQSAFMKRNYIGFELNSDYIKMFQSYLKISLDINRKEYELQETKNSQYLFESQILELRALKFARLLINNIEKEISKSDLKILVSIKGKSTQKNKLIIVDFQIIGIEENEDLLRLIDKLIAATPLSRFGIEPKFGFAHNIQFQDKTYYGYSKINTSSYLKDVDILHPKVKVISEIKVNLNENNYS